MIRKVPEKTFDCVEFKRAAQQRIYQDIKGLSTEEQIEYFRQRAENGPLGQWWKTLKQSRAESAGRRGQ